jgi:hypothetical protein
MGSIRTNPAYNDAVSKFWYQNWAKSKCQGIGKIRLMDEQTNGERAIAKGNQRQRYG